MLEKAIDHTFVASAISPAQLRLLEQQPPNKPIYVEGGFTSWLRDRCLYYFILRADTAELFHENELLRQKQEDEEGKEVTDLKLIPKILNY